MYMMQVSASTITQKQDSPQNSVLPAKIFILLHCVSVFGDAPPFLGWFLGMATFVIRYFKGRLYYTVSVLGSDRIFRISLPDPDLCNLLGIFDLILIHFLIKRKVFLECSSTYVQGTMQCSVCLRVFLL